MDKEYVVHICDGMLLSCREDEMLPFVRTQMGLQSIMLSKIRQTRKGQEVYDFTHMWDIKQKERNKFIGTDNNFKKNKIIKNKSHKRNVFYREENKCR